jgi:aryl-alcohol dehydrogenase-like predicted oxidoreductase
MTDEELAWHAASGVPLVLYSATANGFFAGRGHDNKDGYAGDPENRARYRRAVELSARRGGTPTQVALAYLLHQEARVIPLFAQGNREHLAEALGAAAITLQPQEVRWLRDGLVGAFLKMSLSDGTVPLQPMGSHAKI